ncbi:MAG TPA: hypothetical protein PLP61_05440 [Nocardioides sp.]|uniref:hypothetical protein n=1 Tax=Nocardioides sp. TaxID=35761 RepID=UPI002C6A9375|nr:hypothetical protein [Nocardioides sp.]HQR26466.1 hypothetical protein [Nocardioides sp.]
MTASRVRTTRGAKAAVVGLGVVGALGTAAALGVATGQATADTGTTSGGSAPRAQREADDDGRWTPVQPPSAQQPAAPPAAQSSGS